MSDTPLSPDSIDPAALWREIGRATTPRILDLRTDEDFAADPRFIPGARRVPWRQAPEWGAAWSGRDVVVYCQAGRKLSQGAAAWLRHHGARARFLAGGFEAWRAADHPAVPSASLPPADAAGRGVWVTRARPKIDRIACPWLIRRFVDPDAVMLFVEPDEVDAVAARFDAEPFDVPGARWSHVGEHCSFDAMVQGFGLATPSLSRLAAIVRGADTARPDLAPEAAGLLAISLGLSRLHARDLDQLAAGLVVYDALYCWARDARGETHDWVVSTGRS